MCCNFLFCSCSVFTHRRHRERREREGGRASQVGRVLVSPRAPVISSLSLSLSLSPTTDPRRYVEPPSMLEFHPMQGRSLPDPLAWERDPGTWTQPTRRAESASSTHKVIHCIVFDRGNHEHDRLAQWECTSTRRGGGHVPESYARGSL